MFDGDCAMVTVGLYDGQDITETLKAIKTAQQLAEDYEQIFANAAIPIVQIDLEGKVSHLFGHVFGRPRIRARARSLSSLTHSLSLSLSLSHTRIRGGTYSAILRRLVLLCCRVR
jgi:hypothetical protein